MLLVVSWTTLEKVPGDVTSWCQFYLAAKPPHVGVDVNGLAFPLHGSMACGRQMRRQGFLLGVILLSCCSGWL
jgi:hypothetical protein